MCLGAGAYTHVRVWTSRDVWVWVGAGLGKKESVCAGVWESGDEER